MKNALKNIILCLILIADLLAICFYAFLWYHGKYHNTPPQFRPSFTNFILREVGLKKRPVKRKPSPNKKRKKRKRKNPPAATQPPAVAFLCAPPTATGSGA